MTAISKNVYTVKLDGIVNKYNNTYHRTIKITPIDVKWSTYIEFDVENNDKDPKFKVGNHLRKKIRKLKYFCKRLLTKLVWRNFHY